jgi:hypothetical protein
VSTSELATMLWLGAVACAGLAMLLHATHCTEPLVWVHGACGFVVFAMASLMLIVGRPRR